MRTHTLPVVLSLVAVLSSSLAFSQTSTVKPLVASTPAAPDYSGESAVLESMIRSYTFNADGTGTRDVTVVAHVQSDAAIKAWSVVTYGYAGNSDRVSFRYLRVRHKDGSVVETPVTDAQDMPAPITRDAPFYSDLKELQIPVRSLSPGDHVEYSVHVERTRSEAPGRFWGQEQLLTPRDGAVVLSEVVELHVPKSAFVQVWSPAHKPERPDTATEQVYRWQSHQLAPLAGIKPAQLNKLAPPDPEAEDLGRLPDILWTNFRSWAEVGDWYRSLEAPRIQPDADVRARVAQLTAGKTSTEDKVRALYSYVAPQVRYIGVAFGIGRYQPHEAGEVLRNQYGDCKDKHTLLAAMLKAAGIRSDAVLIGSGVRFVPDVPSPGFFNHVITRVDLDGKPLWLDSTTEVAPFGLLLYTIRGHQALVVPDTGVASVERTPSDLPFPATVAFEAKGELDANGLSHSHITLSARGDAEVFLRAACRNITPAQWDLFAQKFSESLGYSGKVSNASITRAEDTSKPFQIAYDYERSKAGDWDSLRTIPQLAPLGLSLVNEDDPPDAPIELGLPRVENSHAVMKLPAGWSAELPAAIHAHSAFATIDQTYQLENGTLISDRRLEVLKRRVSADDWHTYQRWAKEASLDGDRYIQLTRTAAQSSAVASNDDAEKLIREASNMENTTRDYKAIRAKLDAAKALNPHQAYLWSNYGWLAMTEGKLNEAMDDFNREIADHPGNNRAYILLASVQAQQHRNADARSTLEKLRRIDPADAQAAALLANLQEQDHDLAGAEKTLRDAIAVNADSIELQLALSSTLHHEGKDAEAAPALRALIEKSDNPLVLNNAAYELADNQADLPLAERAARRALQMLETGSAANTGPGAEKVELGYAGLLTATWDTLGWILFRQGKIDEAGPYLQAGWVHGLSAEPGMHYGEFLEKQGRKEDALDVYRLAEVAGKGTNTVAVAKTLAERQKALRDAGVATLVKDPRSALQNSRTFHVPSARPVNGSATVDIDFTANGPQNPRFITGDSALQPLAAALKNVDFNLLIPANSRATLRRRGVLSCHPSTKCLFVLMDANAALGDANR